MTTNLVLTTNTRLRQQLLCFNFLLTLILPFSAHADGKTNIDSSLVYSELFAGTMSILVAQDPKGAGHYLICCVATIGAVIVLGDLLDSRQNELKKDLMVAGTYVAYGMWNISMGDDDKTTVFRNNFLLLNSVVLFDYLNSRQASASETINPSSIQFAPTKNGGTFVYQYRF